MMKNFTRAEILASLKNRKITEAAVDVAAAVKMYSNLWAGRVAGRRGQP
jgi:hypothetical protein